MLLFNYENFWKKIRELRSDNGLTQKQAAEALSVTIPTLSHWECDYQEPSFKDLAAICRFYKVTSDYLLGLEE